MQRPARIPSAARSTSACARPVDSLADAALRVYSVSLAGEALQSYALWGVPLPWAAQGLTIGFVLFLLLQARFVRVAGLGALALLLSWGAVVTLASAASGEFARLMPQLATTSYPVFVALRFISLIALGAQVYLVYWLLARGRMSEVVQRTITVALAFAAIAVYVYVAQSHGLPVPPKNRMDTGGLQHVATYTYAFHRAVGTFQEPADLASWLVSPLFLTLLARRRAATFYAAFISGTLLLTGSLAAIAGAAAGLAGAVVLLCPLRRVNARAALQCCLAIAAAALIFRFVAVANDEGTTNLLSVLADRLQPILDDGLQASNRDYIYNYVKNAPFPLLGVGFGNSNLLLTSAFGSVLMVSFLSAYLYVFYSTGCVGLVLFAAFLLAPLKTALVCRWNSNQMPAGLVWLAGAYLSYLVMIGFRAEEIPVGVGSVYAMLTFVGQRGRTSENSVRR